VAKDSPRITDGELQRLLESWGTGSLKKYFKQPLHHHMLFGRVSRKILLAPPKTNSSNSVVTHDWNFKRDWMLCSDETKKGFLAANPPDVFGANRNLVQIHGIMDSSKYQQIKKKNRTLTASTRNPIMGCGWIFHQDSGLKTSIFINTKNGDKMEMVLTAEHEIPGEFPTQSHLIKPLWEGLCRPNCETHQYS